jgi:hypothetical protein
MSLYDYLVSVKISAQDQPFYALIMAAMRQADDRNVELLKAAFPAVWDELRRRYRAGGGILPEDE